MGSVRQSSLTNAGSLSAAKGIWFLFRGPPGSLRSIIGGGLNLSSRTIVPRRIDPERRRRSGINELKFRCNPERARIFAESPIRAARNHLRDANGMVRWQSSRRQGSTREVRTCPSGFPFISRQILELIAIESESSEVPFPGFGDPSTIRFSRCGWVFDIY